MEDEAPHTPTPDVPPEVRSGVIPEALAQGGDCLLELGLSDEKALDTHDMDDDERPPICARCGVTMVPAALSADDKHESDWVCLECEQLDEDE